MNKRLVCRECADKLDDSDARRYLSLAHRLWARCFLGDNDCWEISGGRSSGRPPSIMADRRQIPPAQAALWLSGSPRPSPLHVAHHKFYGNAFCVRPDHHEWIQATVARGPMWAHLMTPDQLANHLELQRAKKAQYQRTYRRKLKDFGGTRTVREGNNLRDLERARALSADLRENPPPPLTEKEAAMRAMYAAREAAQREAQALPAPVLVVAPVPVPPSRLTDYDAKYAAEYERVTSAPAVTVKPPSVASRTAPWRHGIPEAAAPAPEALALELEPLAKPRGLLSLLAAAKVDPAD